MARIVRSACGILQTNNTNPLVLSRNFSPLGALGASGPNGPNGPNGPDSKSKKQTEEVSEPKVNVKIVVKTKREFLVRNQPMTNKTELGGEFTESSTSNDEAGEREIRNLLVNAIHKLANK